MTLTAPKLEFRVGDEVKYFTDDSLFVQYGKIIRVCKETCVVLDSYGYKVRVKKNKLNWD